jgi:hypothetical protein
VEKEESLMTQTTQAMNISSGPSAGMERRSSLRYPLRAAAVFAWDDELGQHRERHGHTRDVGRMGAYIFASDCPVNGTRIALSVFLPASKGEGTLRIEADGCVVRAEAAGEDDVGAGAGAGFAVSHQRMNLFSR